MFSEFFEDLLIKEVKVAFSKKQIYQYQFLLFFGLLIEVNKI